MLEGYQARAGVRHTQYTVVSLFVSTWTCCRDQLCYHHHIMKKSTFSILTIISIASLMVTFFLAQTTAKYEIDKNDALSFEAPHLQTNNQVVDDTVSRRNLSEVAKSTGATGKTPDALNNNQMIVGKKKSKEDDQSNNSDNRPSGVIYQYIPPPPINITARSLLSAQFPNLVNLDDTSTSTALCGIVKDAEQYLDEWVDYHFGLGFHTM